MLSNLNNSYRTNNSDFISLPRLTKKEKSKDIRNYQINQEYCDGKQSSDKFVKKKGKSVGIKIPQKNSIVHKIETKSIDLRLIQKTLNEKSDIKRKKIFRYATTKNRRFDGNSIYRKNLCYNKR